MSEPVQLELGLEPPGEEAPRRFPRLARLSRGHLARGGRWLLGWLPVLALLAAFTQVTCLGLRRARHEADRLARAEQVVRAREDRLAEHNAQLVLELRALSDPVFEARVARARRSRAFPAPPRPLELLDAGPR